ncbi:MAG TPA: Hsp20/alpha crystallin family protein [Candidatus Polarisedimenticolaceae bacterium]|nr:Hsp20/alpha crystallin family protein [Candidatus Polarisedimenticolaceae bacterium]
MTSGLGSMLEVARIQSEINRLFDNLLDLDEGGKESGSWIPMADIVETDDALLVTVELPGVAAADLAVSTHGGDVILKGEKRRPAVTGPARFHVAERDYGRFRRVIHLGAPVNTHKAEARLADGNLRIRFPKVANRRGEEVAIEVREG